VGLGYVALILNSRYNDKLTTIITTNYPDLSAAGGGLSDPERAAREPTLGDRIGDRMRSRLAEMCVKIEMNVRTSADSETRSLRLKQVVRRGQSSRARLWLSEGHMVQRSKSIAATVSLVYDGCRLSGPLSIPAHEGTELDENSGRLHRWSAFQHELRFLSTPVPALLCLG